MELKTYANLMNQTESFPWIKFLSGNCSQKSEGSKKERVNNSAKNLFEREFLKKYEGKKIVFGNDSGKELSLKLEGIKFNANHTNYDLIFATNEIKDFDPFWIRNDNYVDPTDRKKIENNLGKNYQLKENSKNLVNEMLDY